MRGGLILFRREQDCPGEGDILLWISECCEVRTPSKDLVATLFSYARLVLLVACSFTCFLMCSHLSCGRAMFTSRDYCESRVEALKTAGWPHFLGTRVLDTLAPLIPGTSVDALRGLSTACMELGGDAWGVLRGMSKTYSMGGLFLRGNDVHEGDKNRRPMHFPLMLIPGPRQPRTMGAALDMIVQELLAYQPGRGGVDLVVKPVACGGDFATNGAGGT